MRNTFLHLTVAVVVLFLLAPPAAHADCVVAPAQLVAWWRAENNASDSAGTNHGALLNGTTFVPGLVSQAFNFDGLDDYVSVPDSANWDFGANDFTIEFWTKLDQVKKTMFLHQQSGAVRGGFEFDLQPSTGSATLVFALDPDLAGITRTWSPASNTWYHLAVTRSAGAFRLYVDGQQLGAEQFDARPVVDVSGPLRIGNYTESLYEMDGLLDELSIYSRALSAAEIQAIYNAGSAGKCVRRMEWFKIAGGGGESTNATHRLRGTAGQHDAGGPLTNAQHSLVGGFWALPMAIQVAGAPTLTIAPATPGNATISWSPNTPGFVLQETWSLSNANWTNSLSGATNPSVVPSTSPAKFYRLFKP